MLCFISSRLPVNRYRLAVLIRVNPDTVHRLSVFVENVLAAIVVSVDGPGCAVRELAFASCMALILSEVGVLVRETKMATLVSLSR